MSGPKSISLANVNLTMQNFRDMVNYENTTNRGYVRTALGKDGNVVLEKVSKHWYSLPFHGWRSRVDVTSNQEMRQKFIDALKADLKIAGADAGAIKWKSIEDRVIYQPGTEIKRTESLSRKEIESVMRDYDDAFNTPSGRCTMRNNLIGKLIEGSGYEDVDLFKKEVLLIETVDEEFESFKVIDRDEQGNIRKQYGLDRMKRSDMEFRQYLSILKSRADEARKLRNANSDLESNMLALLKTDLKDGYLSENAKAKLSGALQIILKQEISRLGEVAGIETAAGFLRAFVEEVVPQALKHARDELVALGIDAERNPDEFKAYIEQTVGSRALVDKAREFLQQATVGFRDLDDWTDQLKKNFGNGREISDSLLPIFKIGAQKSFVKDIAWTNLAGKSRDKYIEELLKGFDGAFKEMKDESVRDLFVKSFVVANYGGDPEEKIDIQEKFIDRTQNLRADVKNALQTVLGERTTNGERVTDSPTMDDVIKKITGEDGVEALKKANISGWTINQLMIRSLPKIINQSIGRNREAGLSMYSERTNVKSIIQRLGLMGQKIDKFWNEKLNSEFKKSFKQAEKLIKNIALRQGWPIADMKPIIKGSFRDEYLEMAENAIIEMLDEHVYIRDETDDIWPMLESKFRAGCEELMGKVNERLVHYASTRTTGMETKVVKDSFLFVRNELSALNRELPTDAMLNESEVDELASGALKRKWNELVLKNLPRHAKGEKYDDKRINELKAEFSKIVKEELNRVSEAKLEISRQLTDSCTKFVEFSFEDEKGMMHGYNSLTIPGEETKDTKAIARIKKMLTDRLLLRTQDVKSEIMKQILRNPDAGKVGEAVERQLRLRFDASGSHELSYLMFSECRNYADVIQSQIGWIAPKDGEADHYFVGDIKDHVNPDCPYRSLFSENEHKLIRMQAFGLKEERVVERARKYPLAYPTDSNGFREQVAGEGAKLIEKYAYEYDRFRQQVFAEAAEIADGYSGLDDGTKREIIEYCVEEIARANLQRLKNKLSGSEGRTEPVTLEDAKKFVDSEMFSKLNGIANRKFEEFMVVSKRIEKAYNEVKSVVEEEFSLENVGLSFNEGVPKAVVTRFIEVMKPRIFARYETRLNLEFSKDTPPTLAVYSYEVRDEIRKFLNAVGKDVSAWMVDQRKDTDADLNVYQLVRQTGVFGDELKNDDVRRLICDNLATWGANEEVDRQVTEIMNMIVDESLAKFEAGENFVESGALKAKKEILLNDLRSVARGVVKSVFHDRFSKELVPAALALIDVFIRDGWRFAESSQVPKMIREVVYKRICELEKQETIPADTVILDYIIDGGPGTMDKIYDIVNGAGSREKVINDRGNVLVNEYTAQFISTYPELFNAQREELSQLEKTSAAINLEELGLFIKDEMLKSADVYLEVNNKIHDAEINLSQFDKLVVDQIGQNKASVLETCMARMTSAREMPGIVTRKTEECVQKLVEKINSKRPAAKHIRIGSDWTIENLDVLNDMPEGQQRLLLVVGFIRDEFRKRMEQISAEAFRKLASGKLLEAEFAKSVENFFKDVSASSVPEALVRLKIDTKKHLFYKTSWLDVFAGTLKTK